MKYILKKMRNKKNRSAVFVCSLCIKIPSKRAITVVGKLEGHISYKIIGKKGFGYDPIFIPKYKKITFGQMSQKKKIRMDHRYIAFKKLKKKLKLYKLIIIYFINIEVLSYLFIFETKSSNFSFNFRFK